MNIWTFFWILLLLSASLLKSYAQSNAVANKAILMKELEKRNIAYEDLEARLIEEGFDVANLDLNTLSSEEQQRIQNIIAELSLESPEISQPAIEEKEPITNEPISISDPEPATASKGASRSQKEIIYGQSLFRNDIITIVKNSNQLKAPESYVLGQGDQIVISIWGPSQLEKSFTIQEDGYIKVLDGRVRVFLKGLTLAQARSKLRQLLSASYSFGPGEFDLAVNYARTVWVTILGEALRRPGAYTLSGFNTAFNALSLVGGPSDIGSLRNILVQKSDGQKLELDVYAFMTDPSVQNDFYLNDNDIILIPVSEKIVEIQGAVRRPLKYELKDGEMLSALLRFAGGFADNAYMDKIQVVRYEANKQRIIDINLTEYMAEGRDFELRNGDEIIVSEIEKSFDNYGSVTGEVYQPGQYERTNNMRISDIVSMAGLTPRSNTSLIYLIRTNPDNTKALLKLDFDRIKSNLGDKDNLLLADGDKIEIWSKDRFTDESVISDSGAV